MAWEGAQYPYRSIILKGLPPCSLRIANVRSPRMRPDAPSSRVALMTGRDATIDAMAQRPGLKRDCLSVHMRLTYLAPDIVRAFLSGRYPPELTPGRLVSLCKDLPNDWQLQRTVLGFETR